MTEIITIYFYMIPNDTVASHYYSILVIEVGISNKKHFFVLCLKKPSVNFLKNFDFLDLKPQLRSVYG